MKKLPYTTDEWDAVRWAAAAVTEAANAGDADGRAARFADLQSLLGELQQKHGDHPLLWETEADFTPDPAAAADLYRVAEALAVAADLPTLTIRLSLARLLAEELGQPAEAREALLACRDELPWARDADCVAWAKLLAACPPEFPSVFDKRPDHKPDCEPAGLAARFGLPALTEPAATKS
jgi:hypothetical protein